MGWIIVGLAVALYLAVRLTLQVAWWIIVGTVLLGYWTVRLGIALFIAVSSVWLDRPSPSPDRPA